MSNSTLFSSNMKIVSSSDNVTVANSSSNTATSFESTGSLEQRRDQKKIDEGYQTGWSECEEKMQITISELEAKIHAITLDIPKEINIYTEKLEEEIKEEICNIAFNISKVIINREVENKNILSETIKDITGEILNKENLNLYLNPEIVSLIESGDSDINTKGIVISSDASLELNDARLETSQGIIDASLNTRLETLKDSLNKALMQ